MRNKLILLAMLLVPAMPSQAEISFSLGISTPNVSIGINLPAYPTLVAVPGYPVYYAPQLSANYFFYDGMYWVFQGDNWYASSWYNGPWGLVSPEIVPVYILRVPVRYYRVAPPYFRGWRSDAPPRWGDRWGNDWARNHDGWDRWNRNAIPARSPLPVYQKQYYGDRYPRPEQQQQLQSQNYRYQPREPVVRQHYEAQRSQVQPGRGPGAMQDNRRYEQPQPSYGHGQGGNRGPMPPQGAPSYPRQGQMQEPERGGRPQGQAQMPIQGQGQAQGQGRERERKERGERGENGERGERR